MKINKRKFIILLVIVLIVGIVLGACISAVIGGFGVGSVKISNKEYTDLKYMSDKYTKLEKIWNTVDSNFYKEVDDKKLEEAMYKGLVAGLGDEYSEYLTKEEYETWIVDATGEYEGVGISFSEDKKGNMVIITIEEGSPADKAGVKVGDYILKADGKSYKDSIKLSMAIRGDAGTSVKILFERKGKKYTKTITRANIIKRTVKSKELGNKIGYIQIDSFEKSTEADFNKALSKIEKNGDKGFILDLRNNGGGLVDSATKIADKLLGKGVITYLKDQDGNKTEYKSDKNKTKLPYVVLVNENTASASEILTAAIKDSTNNKIVGVKTYGKGVVQDTAKLDDGSGLKLTVMQYYSPEGHVIHKKGITPNYKIKSEKKQLEKAKALLK